MRGGGRVARGGLGSARRRDDGGEWGRAGAGRERERRVRARDTGQLETRRWRLGSRERVPRACVGVAEGRKRKDVKNV